MAISINISIDEKNEDRLGRFWRMEQEIRKFSRYGWYYVWRSFEGGRLTKVTGYLSVRQNCPKFIPFFVETEHECECWSIQYIENTSWKVRRTAFYIHELFVLSTNERGTSEWVNNTNNECIKAVRRTFHDVFCLLHVLTRRFCEYLIFNTKIQRQRKYNVSDS